MKQSVVAIDFDDVLAGFNRAYVAHSTLMYGSSVTYAQAITFDMPKLYDVSGEEIVKRVRNFCHTKHGTIEPVEEGLGCILNKLSSLYKLHIVTSRCESLEEVTTTWLQERDLLTYFTDMHFTNGFGSDKPNKRTKLEVCQEINARVLFEDAPSNALLLARAGIPVLLPDRPWNQEVEHPLIHRYHSLPDALNWMKEYIPTN